MSVSSSRVFIQNRKIGFFKFALLNEVKLEDAKLVLFATDDDQKNIDPEIASQPSHPVLKSLIFDTAFSENLLKLFPTKRIVSIVLEPASIELRNSDSVVSRISADSAVIRFKQRDILFQNNVKVQSSEKKLLTEELTFHPENSTLVSKQDFMFDSMDKKWEGKGFTTDIFLNSIGFR